MQVGLLTGVLAAVCFSGAVALAQSDRGDCGTGGPCEIEGGTYYAALPDTATDAPVVLWLHGYGGRANKAAASMGMARNFTKHGYIFVAPQGTPNPEKPKQRDWNVADGYDEPRDDLVFLSRVLDDVASRFDTDPARILLTGFSRGASMAWDYACAMPDRVTGVAVAAGGFWEPMTPDCVGPTHLFHTHGFNDRTVPLEGRKVSWGGVDFHQGNILKGLDVWREVNGCTGAADKNAANGPVWHKRWTNCEHGSIQLHLTPGGHGIPKGWSSDVMDWFDHIAPAQG